MKMKKLMVFAISAGIILFTVPNFVSALDCFDRQFIDDSFEISFDNPMMGYYVENLLEFKGKFVSQREELLRLAGVFCGDTKVLRPREIWDNAGIIVKNEFNRWKDFKILWESLYLDENGAIRTKVSQQDAGADFEKKTPTEWRQEYFVNLLIHQTAYMTSSRSPLALEELISDLDVKNQEEIFKSASFSRWKEAFDTIVTEIKNIRARIEENLDGANALDSNLEKKHLSDDFKISRYPNR